MKAMSYARYGGTEVLEQTNLPAPKVSPGSVLIRVKAAAVNPVDWKVMAGYLDPIMDVVFPVVPGWDVAGVVEAVGLDTPEFAVGDEVYSYGRRDTVHGGTFAEFVALPAAAVARKPASLGWEQAAGLPLTGLTALRTLDALRIGAGDVLLIHNGAGGVGRMAIQLAVHAGARPLATASAKNHARLRELGAEPVEYGDGLADRVRALAPDGVDAVADFAGAALEATLAVLKPGGRHASIADASVSSHGGRYVWVRPDGPGLDRLSALADAGTLAVDVAASYPMEQAAAAFEDSMSGHGGGKIVLTAFSK
ncbi:NADP-dependent oxidoreductase [Arthrobacter sp. STN4]|uniref:NADP-dependent oxidoreductase n=1 Tax=Arthrobacter sp. STN4 TaxID=2923276 RepID=UPI002119EF2B|nr:NADP-dependent oxidoreductase [Arthrobacter sp. STN4]MCQ9162848.1 NADP-dependent oxidoreductase [Arthrobacter sp. STN4]